MTAPRPTFPRSVEWRVRATHLALAVERLWALLWPAGGYVGAYLAASLLNLWGFVPGLVHLAILLALAAGTLWSLHKGLNRFAWPSREEAVRRLEDDNGLTHRPLSTYSDHIGIGKTDENAITLWATYRTRLRRQFAGVRPGAPRSDIPTRDPWALRVAVVISLFIGIAIAGRDAGPRIGAGLSPDFSNGAEDAVRLDAWITPPDYTGHAPLFLTEENEALENAQETAQRVEVPVGSTLSLRISGSARAPELSGAVDDITLEDIDEETWRVTASLNRSGMVTVRGAGDDRTWDFDLTPDIAPEIAFAPAPGPTELGLMGLPYTIHDDYGVTNIEAELQLVPQPQKDGGYEDAFFTDEGRARAGPLYPADERDTQALALPSPEPRSAEDDPSLDWRAHPWAGREVLLQLTAVDAAGGRGYTTAEIVELPVRRFRNPLAAAVAEQRALLVRGDIAVHDVTRTLDALTTRADLYLDDITAYLGLRGAVWSLRNHPPADDLRAAYDALWALALRLEDGDLSLALDRIRELEQQLLDALSRDASNQEIRELMAELRQAIQDYMDAFQAQNPGETPEELQSQRQPQQDGNAMDQNDLASLLDRIEDLAQMGSRQAARDLLEGLSEMLAEMENQPPQQGGSGGMSEQEQAMAGALEGLSDLLGEQRQLLDETFRGAQGEEDSPYARDDPWEEWGGWPPPEDWPYNQRPEEGSPAAPDGSTARNAQELAQEQLELMEELAQLMQDLLDATGEAPGALGEAENFMDDSEGELGGGSYSGSVPAQEQAIEALRESLDSLAQTLMAQMNERQGQQQAGQQGRDPLGRDSANQGPSFGEDVRVPTEREMQRARELLEELRRRAGEQDRPELELDYLERLLRRF